MSQKIDGKEIRVIVPYEILDRVDHISEREGCTKSETVRKLLNLGVGMYDDCSKLGIASLARVIDKARKGLRKEVGQQELFVTE